jgi:hypothetical protein
MCLVGGELAGGMGLVMLLMLLPMKMLLMMSMRSFVGGDGGGVFLFLRQLEEGTEKERRTGM